MGVVLLSPRARFLISIGPTFAIFAVTEWLILSQSESFSGALSWGGVLGGAAIAAFFPILLTVSAKKGDVLVEPPLRMHTDPIVRVAICLLFLSAIFLHGALDLAGSARASRGDHRRRHSARLLPCGARAPSPTVCSSSCAKSQRPTGSEASNSTQQRWQAASDDGQVALRRPATLLAGADWRDRAVQCAPRNLLRTTGRSFLELKVWAHRLTSPGSPSRSTLELG